MCRVHCHLLFLPSRNGVKPAFIFSHRSGGYIDPGIDYPDPHPFPSASKLKERLFSSHPMVFLLKTRGARLRTRTSSLVLRAGELTIARNIVLYPLHLGMARKKPWPCPPKTHAAVLIKGRALTRSPQLHYESCLAGSILSNTTIFGDVTRGRPSCPTR